MYLLLSRPATHSRGDFAVDTYTDNKQEAEQRLKEYQEADKIFGVRERMLVHVLIRSNS